MNDEPRPLDTGVGQPTPGQQTPGQHTLGPHVVGSRVVVRRLVPGETGPSGGPAMTDVLGVCEAWGDGVCVVRPADGVPVTIALRDVVSGKPVPPRPSVRDRVPARVAQEHGFALFPDLVTEPLGGWVLRDSATATARRANSVLAFGPSGLDGDTDVERVLAHYDRPVAAVLTGSPEHARLTALGWVPESNESDTLFQVAALAQVSRALRGAAHPDAAVHGTTAPGGTGDEAWVRVTVGDHATAFAALDPAPDGDWLGLGGLAVDPAQRRRGLGLAALAACVGWGGERGASTVFLQVLGDNAPALALYERLGFRTHHRYRYLTPR
ncbi:GNAT family N-acetyltransferase [Nocardioides dongxiaopingii]|uniref:GNAT family N-acetyltransferase n=1 Tax=Nocardioides dongxiaopingii TaxID=2576036 RepID=UPI0010C76D1F|nr:GNAT family N-acetyltransferase [Nocardioides dongxiaopingii]